MKKELSAVILLILMTAIALFNIFHLRSVTGELIALADKAESSAAQGDFISARSFIKDAAELWESEDYYTHIFIAHSEIDGTADSLFNAAAQLSGDKDSVEITAAFDELRYHLMSILRMEEVSIGSIF